MGKYILRNDLAEFEKQFEISLSKVVEKIVENNKRKIHSVVLVGSMSRGEGTAINGENPRLMNDVDIAIIKKGRFSNLNLVGVPKEINGGKLDISEVPKGKLGRLRPEMEYVDWKLSGKMLFGAPSFNAIRTTSKDIPASTTYEILYKRLAYWINCFTTERVSERIEKSMKSYVLSKVILGSFDALLISRGEYTPGREEKIKLAKQLLGLELYRTYLLAWKIKGNPHPVKLSLKKLAERAGHFLKNTLEVLGLPSLSWEERKKKYSEESHILNLLVGNPLKNLKKMVLGGRDKKLKFASNLGLFLSVESYTPVKVNPEKLSALETLLKKEGLKLNTVSLPVDPVKRWFALREHLNRRFTSIKLKLP